MIGTTPLGAWVLLAVLTAGSTARADEPASQWFDRQTEWQGYEQFHFRVAGRPAYLVAPRQPAPGNPWIWRARFPSYHAEMDIALLGQGYHVAYVDVAGLFGSPAAVKMGDAFYRFVTVERGLAEKVCLEGVSRGGLFVYNWAARNTEKVACIYCDTPVCDFKSWPGGKGNGLGAAAAWRQCLQAYGLGEDEALRFDGNPIDHAQRLARAKTPILHIVSENDRVVPPAENTYVLRRQLQEHGHDLELISVPEGTAKSNGHHFDHPDPDRVVAFIRRYSAPQPGELPELLRQSRRILFLGDSITYAGDYVAYFDAWLLTRRLKNIPVVLDAGLPSETVSGLSEDGHAGGRFPRPDLAERLERVLKVTRPDLVLACYGINCGIYQPFDQQRLKRYQDGMKALKSQVEAAGATLVLITPPCYDDQRGKKPFSYNAVLDRYAQWLLEQRDAGWLVVDLHGPMTRELSNRRQETPEFTFQPDAVHPRKEGHWFIAQQLMRAFGDDGGQHWETPEAMLDTTGIPTDVLPLVRQRMTVLRDAYLGAAGHRRPGIKAGLPVPEAEQRARGITGQIREALEEQ